MSLRRCRVLINARRPLPSVAVATNDIPWPPRNERVSSRRHRVSHGGDFGTTSVHEILVAWLVLLPRPTALTFRGQHGFTAFLADRGTRTAPNHRAIAGDSPAAEATKVLARGHENLIWFRTRRTNALRSALRE